MKTKEAVENLRLLANTIEELEIDNIIGVCIDHLECHLRKLKLTGVNAVWKERYSIDYPWEKSFNHNNIHFFALYSQEDYNKEFNHGTS